MLVAINEDLKQLLVNMLKILLTLNKFLPAVIITFLLICHHGFAQVDSAKKEKTGGFESYRQAGQKGFEDYKNKQQQDFQDYKRKNDSIFIAYLKGEWKTYPITKSEEPSIPKPKTAPVFESMQILEFEIQPGSIIYPEKTSEIPDVAPFLTPEPAGARKETVSFYNSPVSILKTTNATPLPSVLSPSVFDQYFEKAIGSPVMEYNAASLYYQAKKMRLNDWGVVQLVRKTAGQLTSDANEQALFIWYVLLRNGYIVKAGYNSDKIYLLVHPEHKLYTVNAVIDGKAFYVLPLEGEDISIKSLDSYSNNYPENQTRFTLKSDKLPSFPSVPIPRKIGSESPIEITLDKNLLDYFSSFPPGNLSVQYSTPFSKLADSSLTAVFLKQLEGKTDPEKVGQLLQFVQGFPYQNDLDQFGREKYMFAEQSLFYPYTDCDDRAVLLARLIRLFTRCKVIGLQYNGHEALGVSGHVALGVSFQDRTDHGAYVEVDGLKYYYCDPTYIHAGIGMISDKYREEKPGIIFIY